jgi:hypothetical protein
LTVQFQRADLPHCLEKRHGHCALISLNDISLDNSTVNYQGVMAISASEMSTMTLTAAMAACDCLLLLGKRGWARMRQPVSTSPR